MKLLITGSKGQLGSEIKELSHEYPEIDFFFKDFPELDICNSDLINSFIKEKNIKAVINCAAYSSVEKAEENIEMANKVNSTGVFNLVNALSRVDGKLIHISTDYVFDGTNLEPYKELDPVRPLGIYGKSKRHGELVIINSSIDAIIIRTSWLYSSYGNNFVKRIIRLGNVKDSINIVSDQFGTPTYAGDLAKVCLDLISNSVLNKISCKGKIYHYSNEGDASWFDFASYIIELSGLKCSVQAIQTKDYPTLAERPRYSVLDKTKIKQNFKLEIPTWRESLKKCIIKLKK